jgi:maleamate amidohydrolase
MSLGFRPLVVCDCVGDRAIGPHEANLFDMEQKYATVATLRDTLGATSASPRSR